MEQLSTALCKTNYNSVKNASFLHHSILHLRLTSVLFFLLLTTLMSNAQTPTITKTSGFPVGANIPCYGIAYGASKYASITNTGDVYTSSDGNVWTKSASLGQTLNNIIFANSLFVVVGGSGYIATSTDAVTWTQRTSGTTNTLNDVQYLQSVYYAVGQNRTILSSSNGTTWAAVTVGVGTATDGFSQIAYGGGKYVITANSTTGQGPNTYQSTTAASSSWSTVGGFGVFGNTYLNKMAFLNGKFIIITSSTAIFTSTDGASWTNITATMSVTLPNSTTTTVGNGNYFNTIYYDGSTYYWCGYSTYNNGGYGAIFTSTNLTALTLQSNPLSFLANKAYLLNGKHFIAGNEGLAVSSNGTSYSFSNGSFNALAYNGSNYVGVGYISSNGNVFSSTTFNSNTWTNRSLGSQKPLFGVVHNGSKFVAVGDRTVISSTDGNTWSSIATPAETFACLAYGGSKYVVGGYTIDYANYFLKYSSDGITWTTASTANVTFFKVRYVNGAFYAMGIDNNYPASSGIIMRSTDGITWTNITPSNLAFNVYYYNDVTWDGTKYHFLGADATYTFFTISSATPATTTSYANKGTISNMPGGVVVGSSYGEGAIAYSNGKFVATAIDATTYAAYLVYSSNGTTWTTSALTDKSNINDIIIDNGKFRLIGSGDEKITVEFLPTTWNGTTWSGGAPDATVDAIIASSTTPGSFTCKSLTINSTYALNIGSGVTATVNGNIINNGIGISGIGNLTIAASSTISGNTISFSGKLTVNSGATLTTADLLTLASDATNTGYVANSAGTISGNVTVQRYIPGKRVYRFLSHPFTGNLAMSSLTDNIDITGAGGTPFTTTGSNSSSAFSYDNTNGNSSLTNDPGWQALTAASTFNTKTAYRILVRGTKGQVGSLNGGVYTPAAVTLDWTGTVNQGNQIITLANNGVNKAYNFIGNPYPSPVDLSLITKGSNINANFSVWNATVGARGAYATQAFTTSYILPSGGAFFTQTSANTNNTITFTEASKSTGMPVLLFRTNAVEDKLIIEVDDAAGNYADKLEFFFDNKNKNYTVNNDALWDAEKMANPDANIYSVSNDGSKLAIDRRPINNNDTIQLGFTNSASASFNFVVKELPSINLNYDLFLRDKWLNTEAPLLANAIIPIQITNDTASHGNRRFEIVTRLKKNTLPTMASKFAVSVFPNPSSDKINVVYAGLNVDEKTNITLINAEGKTVKFIEAGKIDSGSQTINVKQLSNGVYIIQLINGDNKQNIQIIKK